MDHWRHVVDNIPFIGLMAADQRNRPYITRLFEQSTPGILVGLMVAALGVWRSDAVQDTKIQNNASDIVRVSNDVTALKQHIDGRLDSIERKVDYSIGVGNLNNYKFNRERQ